MVLESSKTNLEVTVTDAFEVGKIEGARDILKELKELSIVDPRFHTYMQTRLKTFEEKLELINKYKIIQKV